MSLSFQRRVVRVSVRVRCLVREASASPAKAELASVCIHVEENVRHLLLQCLERVFGVSSRCEQQKKMTQVSSMQLEFSGSMTAWFAAAEVQSYRERSRNSDSVPTALSQVSECSS